MVMGREPRGVGGMVGVVGGGGWVGGQQALGRRVLTKHLQGRRRRVVVVVV